MSTSRREDSLYKHKYRELLKAIDDIKAEIHRVLDMTRIIETDTQRAQIIALNWVLEIIDKYIGKESE